MESKARIEQWQNMTQQDPQNAMGWFSLGNAYREAGQMDRAREALGKAVELDPGLSRGYQLLAQVLLQLEQHQEAGELLTRGYVVAAQRGDVMPQRAMEALLGKLGLPLPPVPAAPGSAAAAAPAAGGGAGGDAGVAQIRDRRSGQMGTRMPDPPMRGPLGKFIFDHYSQETFREWIRMGTKVINELRLDFSNAEHQKVYDTHMMEWLGISQEEVEAYAREKKA